MTTLTPIIATNPLILRTAATTPPATLVNTLDVSAARRSSVVSLGNPLADAVDIYSKNGLLPGQESVRAWENNNQDAVTKAINSSFNSVSTANLVEDTVVPKEGSSRRDYLALLEHAAKESKKSKDALTLDVIKTGRLRDEPSRFFCPISVTRHPRLGF